MMTTKNNTHNNGSIQVDPKWVGLVIGKGGNTLRTLEQQVGGRCRIAHDRNKRNTGTFHIRASSKAYLVKAEEAIQQLIKTKQQQQERPRRPKQNPILSVSTTQRKKVTLRTNFSYQDSIRDRKREKWLKHHATEEEKTQHLAKTQQPEKVVPRPTLNFPRLGKGQQKEVVGVWVGNLDEVKKEKVVTPTPSPESSLSVLKTGEMTAGAAKEKVSDFIPLPKSNLLVESRGQEDEEDAFSEDEWEVPEMEEDEDEWSDGELEYGNFDDEEDLAFMD